MRESVRVSVSVGDGGVWSTGGRGEPRMEGTGCGGRGFGESYIKSEKGILFLNNKIVYNYFMRLEDEDKSITKNINFRLVYDSLKAYRLSSELSDKYGIRNKDLFLNPYLLNWISLWRSRNNSKEENGIFLKEIEMMEKGNKNGLKYKLILKFIKALLKIKS